MKNTINKYNKNQIILARITKIHKSFFEIISANDEIGIVRISDVSDYFVQDLKNILKIGDILYLLVKDIENGKLICSFKENRSDYLRTPFEYNFHNTKKSDFQNLYDFTKREVQKWKELK